MGLFEVYSLLDLEPVKAKGACLWDKNGDKYLDFYGGHAELHRTDLLWTIPRRIRFGRYRTCRILRGLDYAY